MSTDKPNDVSSDQFVNQSCFDFLLIELVPMAYRLAEEAALAEQAASASPNDKPDDDETRESVFYRLETLGYRVGLGLVEKFSRDKPRPTDPLDTIKFLCKDLWSLCFKKQIDNLKTNHRGVYVLTDNHFAPLRRMSVARNPPPSAAAASAGEDGGSGDGGGAAGGALPFLYFPAGLVRGALASLGIVATVTAELGTVGLPSAVFQIRTAGAGAGAVK